MAEKEGIKETKEAVVAAIVLGRFVAERLKDGAGLDDAMALGQKLMDPEFRKLVMDGAQGADLIPAEISDISMAEGMELVEAVLQSFQAA